MVSDFSEWSESVLRSVRSASRRSHQSQWGYVEMDDLQQQAYMWVLEHQGKVDKWVEGGDIALLQHSIFQALHRFTMRERYRRDGTKPADYYHYALPEIEDLLEEVLETNRSFGSSPSDIGTVSRSGKAISEGGDRMAKIADVSAGLMACTRPERAMLMRKYGPERATDEAIASDLDISDTTVGRSLTKALRKIARRLGSEAVKPRKAMSNAQAQHVTRSQEGE